MPSVPVPMSCLYVGCYHKLKIPVHVLYKGSLGMVCCGQFLYDPPLFPDVAKQL